MSARPLLQYQEPTVSPRVKLLALWVSMLFVFVYVDLFSLYRSDFRADLEAGTVGSFTVSQGFLFGITAYIAIPSLLVALTVLLPARAARLTNLVAAAVYLPTILVSAIDDWAYFVAGSVLEAVLLVAIIVVAWRWPKVEVASEGGASPAST